MEEVMSFGSSWFEGGLIPFAIRAVLTWWAAKLVVNALEKAVRKAEERRGRKEDQAFTYVRRIIAFIIYAVAVFSILSGITPLASIGRAALGATSVLAVVVSLAAQETFGNFIAGFFLAITRPFEVGDLVTLPEKNLSGTVSELTFRHTVITTFENTRVIVPNSVMNSAIIEDKAFEGDRTYARWVEVEVDYDTDIDQAEQIIRQIVTSHPDYIDRRSEAEKKAGVPSVIIRTESFDASGVLLRFLVVSKSVAESGPMCSDIRKEILKQFAEKGIVIPYQIIQLRKE